MKIFCFIPIVKQYALIEMIFRNSWSAMLGNQHPYQPTNHFFFLDWFFLFCMSPNKVFLTEWSMLKNASRVHVPVLFHLESCHFLQEHPWTKLEKLQVHSVWCRLFLEQRYWVCFYCLTFLPLWIDLRALIRRKLTQKLTPHCPSKLWQNTCLFIWEANQNICFLICAHFPFVSSWYC